jgi:hypothetical protein
VDTQKIKIRFGQFEFEAEGPTELVQAQYDRFMAAVESAAAKPVEPVPRIINRVMGDGVSVEDSNSATVTAAGGEAASGAVTDAMINRVFRRDGDTLSLLALPQGEDGAPDALMLLLYGHQKINNKNSISGYVLLKGARQSGINLERVDDPLAKRREFVLAAGVRRGRTYSLNNRGVTQAEAILRRTLE